jgi:hypothetical protein
MTVMRVHCAAENCPGMIRRKSSSQCCSKETQNTRFTYLSNASPAGNATPSALPMNRSIRITLAAGLPFNRATAFMEHLGIVIDRGTIRNYARRSFPEVPTTNIFGSLLPLSILSLSELAATTGDGGRIPGAEVLAACGFPSAYRTAPDRLLLPEYRNERKEKENKEERQADHP